MICVVSSRLDEDNVSIYLLTWQEWSMFAPALELLRAEYAAREQTRMKR